MINNIVLYLVEQGHAFEYYKSRSGSHYLKVEVDTSYGNVDVFRFRYSSHPHPNIFNGIDLTGLDSPLNAVIKIINAEANEFSSLRFTSLNK